MSPMIEYADSARISRSECREVCMEVELLGCKRHLELLSHTPKNRLNLDSLGQPGQVRSHGAQSHGALTLREATRMNSQPVCMEEEVYKETGLESSVSSHSTSRIS